MKRFFATLAAAALLLACSDDDKGASYSLEFSGSSTADQTLAEDFTGSHAINISTDAPVELIRIEKLDQQSWCELTVGAANYLLLNVPSVNDTGSPRTAKFSISAGKASLTYTVTQKVLYSLSVSGLDTDDNGNYIYTAPFENAEQVVFTVETSAAGWQLEGKATYDDWWSVDRKSGAGGDKVTVTLGDNPSYQRTLTLTISAEQAHDVTVIITQKEVEEPDMASYFNLYYTVTNTGQPNDKQVDNYSNLSSQYYMAAEYGPGNPKSKFRYETDGMFYIIVGKQFENANVEELPEDECHFIVEYDEQYIYIFILKRQMR
ncbi:MAG: hypothetical protein LIO77_03885 [Rikenellaceae bacterium]|nr:hypothetical protein [Rikenellaceae bacterium]